MKETLKVIGIDFGTTNTAVAFFDNANPKREIISIPYQGAADFLMKKTIPSVVFFDEYGLPKYYGEPALEAGKSKPHLLVDKIKRVIGKTYEEAKKDPLLANIAYELAPGKIVSEKGKDQTTEQHEAIVRVGHIEKKEYLPEDIAAMIFAEAKKDAEAYLSAEKDYALPIDYDVIVITFPANFNVIQRGKIKESAIKAGFDSKKLKFVNEPTAAAFDAVFEGKLSETKQSSYEILVLNVGSGTTDLALVNLWPPNELREGWKGDTVATGGDSALGGTDMDIAIVNWVIEEVKRNPNVNTNMFSRAGKQKLRFSAEDAKIALSEGRCQKTRVIIPGFEALGPELDIKKLNNIAKQVVGQCIAEYNSILSKTKIKDAAYKNIILTGGPMAMPMTKNLINAEFAAPIFTCASCEKQLRGMHPSDEFLEQCKGLPDDLRASAKSDSWLFIHDIEGKKESKNCHEHLIFKDGTHFELTSANTEDKIECTTAAPIKLKSRNHSVIDFDPMMCVARGAAISPLFDYFTPPPHVIRVLVSGKNTAEEMKAVIQLNTQLPARVHEGWIINPWESNLEIHVLEDRKETKYDAQTNTYYGEFTYWGDTNYSLTPSKDDKKVYVGVDVKAEAEEINLFILEDESTLANWLMDPLGYKGIPLDFKQREGTFTVNPSGDIELRRIWGALWAALHAESVTGYKLLSDTLDLFRSANSLQRDGYKLSLEAEKLVDKAWPSFGAIYGFMDSEAERLKALKPSDKELQDEARKAIQIILRDVKYSELTALMAENNWESNLANMAISGEAINLLLENIAQVNAKVEKLGSRANGNIVALKKALESDLQFFQSYSNRGQILLKSREGAQFVEARNRLAALQTNLNAL